VVSTGPSLVFSLKVAAGSVSPIAMVMIVSSFSLKGGEAADGGRG
jgi:hypothetical protein